MNNFAEYISVDQAVKMELGDRTRKEFEKLAHSKAMCDVCESEEAWRYAATGMCFSCTTGESDASEDYELAKI